MGIYTFSFQAVALAFFGLIRVLTRYWKYWKVLNFKIGFQDLEKVLNFAKIYIRYWKSIEILNGKEISSIWAEFY